MDNHQNPPLTRNGRTNLLNLPDAEFEQLDTEAAYARFNAKPKMRLGADGQVHPIAPDDGRQP